MLHGFLTKFKPRWTFNISLNLLVSDVVFVIDELNGRMRCRIKLLYHILCKWLWGLLLLLVFIYEMCSSFRLEWRSCSTWIRRSILSNHL